MESLNKSIILGVAQSSPNTVTASGSTLTTLSLDIHGNLYTSLVALDIGGINANPLVAMQPIDNQFPNSVLVTGSIGYGFNTVTNTFDTLRNVLDTVNGQAPVGIGLLGVASRLQGFNPITGFYDRAEIEGDNADGVAVSTSGHLSVKSHNAIFNGTSWDRQRANQDLVILPSAVYAATTNSADITNYSSKGALFVLDVTAVPGVSTLTFKLQGKDVASGKYYDIDTATVAKAAIGTYTYAIYPALFNDTVSGFTSNMTATNGNIHVPRIFRVQIVHTGAGNFTYSVGASMST